MSIENRRPIKLKCCDKYICKSCLLNHIMITDTLICPFCIKDHTRNDLEYIIEIEPSIVTNMIYGFHGGESYGNFQLIILSTNIYFKKLKI